MPYYREAFRVADLEFIFLRLPGRGGPADLPDEIAGFGVARNLWNMGKREEALEKLKYFPLRTFWPESAFALGEIYWQQGRHGDALGEWKNAAELNRKRKPFPPLDYPFDVAPSMDDIYHKLDAEAKSLDNSTKPADIARRVAALLRLDRQEEAINALRVAPADAPELDSFRNALCFIDRGHAEK
jgi:tetratricopeptide (TPR) repeat protein